SQLRRSCGPRCTAPRQSRHQMKKRKRILLIAVVSLIICASGLLLYISHEPLEPSYEGKPLGYWLNANISGQREPGFSPTVWEAKLAIRQMGTNCLPQLLRMLRRHESP